MTSYKYQSSNICKFEITLKVSYKVYLETKQATDKAAAALYVYPSDTTHTLANNTTETSKKIIVSNNDKVIVGAKLFAMSDGFVFKSASGAKLVIDANGIKMYDKSGTVKYSVS